jgi:hypothetical protein
VDDSTKAIEAIRTMERRASNPFKPEPTLEEMLSAVRKSPHPGDTMIRLNREMTLAELCDFHAKRLGVTILRAERDC